MVSLALAAASAASASRTALLRLSYSSSEIALVPLQALGAFEIVARQFQMGLGLLAAGLRLLQLGLVGARINHEEQVAGLHLRPVLEVDGVNVTRNPGRISTISTASRWPGYSSQLVTVASCGWLTVTLGVGRAAGLGGEQAVSNAAHATGSSQPRARRARAPGSRLVSAERGCLPSLELAALEGQTATRTWFKNDFIQGISVSPGIN